MPNFRFAIRSGGVAPRNAQPDRPSTARYVTQQMSGKTITSVGYSGEESNVVGFDLLLSDGASVLFTTDDRGTMIVYCPFVPLQPGVR